MRGDFEGMGICAIRFGEKQYERSGEISWVKRRRLEVEAGLQLFYKRV